MAEPHVVGYGKRRLRVVGEPYDRDVALDLFAGILVRQYAPAVEWYQRFLGSPPSFLPNEIEAAWELAEHRFIYIREQPEDAGHARHTIFVDDLDVRTASLARRGIEPTSRETLDNGVRKVTYHDPCDNEISFGGAPL